jgi:hypothetical protein
MLAGKQETATDVIVGAASTAAVTDPDLAGSSLEVAVMVADPEAGTLAGAIYSPESEIVPGFADQVTAEL